jgi:hypothetical protein
MEEDGFDYHSIGTNSRRVKLTLEDNTEKEGIIEQMQDGKCVLVQDNNDMGGLEEIPLSSIIGFEELNKEDRY